MNVAPASDVHPHDPGAAPAADAVGSAHRIPQLDGLRGATLVAMLSYSSHRLRGGFVSVDVFFVLSGYLITTLLLRSHRRGSASLGSFYARRARRLFPGLVVFLFGVAVFAVVVARPVDLGQIRGDGLATLAYVYNWHTIVAGHRYGDIFVAPTPLQPMWTLSVEEQFYLAWPLVVGVLVRRARRPLTATLQACAVGAVASGALMVLLSITGVSFTRIYEGTDTRVYAIGATPTHEVYVGPGPNPVTVCDAAFTADLAPRLSAAFRRLGAGGASVTVTTMPYGITDGNPAMLPRTDCVNRTLAGTARSTRGVRLVDLNGFFCPHGRCARLLNGADPRPDGLHFQWPGVVPVVRWLFPQVAGRPPLTGASGTGGSAGSQAGMRSYCAAAKPAWSPVLDLAVPYSGAAKDPSSGTGTLRNALAAVDVGRLRASIDKAPADERPALRRLVNELDRAMRATVAHGYRAEPLRQRAVFGSGPNGPNDFVAATGFLRFTCGLPMYLVQLFPYR